MIGIFTQNDYMTARETSGEREITEEEKEGGKRERDRKEGRVQVFWKTHRKSVNVVKANQRLNSKSIHCHTSKLR